MVNDDGMELNVELNPQPHAQLKAHLKTLHTSLAETGTVDEELRTLLHQLDGDIHHLLQQRAASEGVLPGAAAGVLPATTMGSDTSDDGLSVRAQELAARFAAEHPRMEPVLRQLGNILANMGI